MKEIFMTQKPGVQQDRTKECDTMKKLKNLKTDKRIMKTMENYFSQMIKTRFDNVHRF